MGFLLSIFACLGWLYETPAHSLPIHSFAPKNATKPLIVYISGDGGWNAFSENLVEAWQKQGYGIVALDSKKYFWKEKSPDQFSKDMAVIIKEKLAAWHLTTFVWVGYSFGADVSAFIPAKLASPLAAQLKHLVLISPSSSTDYEIRLLDMAGVDNIDRKYKVDAAMQAIEGVSVLCIIGKEENKSWINTLRNPTIQLLILADDHDYDNHLDALVKSVETLTK